MKANSLPAISGLNWLQGGYAIYRRNPAFLVLICMTYWALVILINLVPLLGPIAASIVMPALSVSVMNACRDLDDGRPPLPGVIFSGFREGRKTLFLLGGLYLALSLGIVLFSALLDGGAMLRFLLTAKTPEATASDPFLSALTPLVILGLFTPVFMAYWYAPILAAWYRLPIFKALFFSFIACWRNWSAFLVYGLVLVVLLLFVPAVVLTLVILILPSLQGLATAFLVFPVLLIAMPIVFASFYVSYRDVFGVSELA
ncbi:MAG: putative transrane protein [Proteobacteria bacterium]|nr:putative transrane protein [Pseudomonadota bacterium]